MSSVSIVKWMVFFSPNNFHETSVSEEASIFADFQFRVFARDIVASNNGSIRRLSFFIGTPLRSISHSYLYPPAVARASCDVRPPLAERGDTAGLQARPGGTTPLVRRPMGKFAARVG